MNAYLLINFVSGLGDTYSTILSALEAYKYLQTLGYKTNLVFETRRNWYFPPTVPLDCLYDLTPFEGNVLYNIDWNVHGGPDLETSYNAKLLLQNQKSYLIYVDEQIPELNNYQSYIYGHTELHRFKDKKPICETQLLGSEVIVQAEKFVPNTENMVAVHYRAKDGRGEEEADFLKYKHTITTFIEQHKEQRVLVCTNGRMAREILRNMYPNVIALNFTYSDLQMYSPFDPLSNKHSTEKYIRHAQEIAAEMCLLRYARKILSVSPFVSNFVTYGYLNNIHTGDYNELFELHF
jgi:hypothetical protein